MTDGTRPGGPRPRSADALAARLERAEKALAEFFAATDEANPYSECRSNPNPHHSHEKRGVWDWDNGPKANTPCRECAAWDKLRSLARAAVPAKPCGTDCGTANPGHPPLDVALDCQRPGSHGER